MTAHATARSAPHTPTIDWPLIDILCHACFKAGFIEAAKGQPQLPDFQDDNLAAWFYERGRLVATEARSQYGRVPQLWLETDEGSRINPQIISLAGAMLMTGAFA